MGCRRLGNVLGLGILLLTSFAEGAPMFRSVHAYPANDLVFATEVAVDSQQNTYMAGVFVGATLVIGDTTLTNHGSGTGFITKLSPDGTALWAKSIGGTQSEYINGLAVDSSDNVFFIASCWSPDTSFDGIPLTTTSNQMSVVFKLDTNGEPLWHRTLDGVSSDGWANPLALDSDGNVHASGIFQNGAIFLRKIDSTGNTNMWTVVHAQCASFGPSLYVNDAGETFLSGNFTNATVSFGQVTLTNHAHATGYAVKYSSAGNPLWAVPISIGLFVEVTDIAADPADNAYVIDRRVAITQITPDGQVCWTRQVSPFSGTAPAFIAPAPDGGVFFAGNYQDEGIVAKISAAGDELWRKASDSRMTPGAIGEPKTAWTTFWSRPAIAHGNIYLTGFLDPKTTPSSCTFDTIVYNPVPRSFALVTLGPPPLLSSTLIENSMTLSWSTNDAGFQLESSLSIAPGSSWQVVTNTVTITGSQFTVTRPIAGNNTFYRLRQILP